MELFVAPPEVWATKLTLGELESLARALLPVLLAFLHAGIARQKSVGPQRRPQLRIEPRNRSRQPHAHRAGLPAHAAAVRGHYDVHLFDKARELQRLGGFVLPGMIREILPHGPVVHGELARTCAKEHAGNRLLAPSCSRKPSLRARYGRTCCTQRSS